MSVIIYRGKNTYACMPKMRVKGCHYTADCNPFIAPAHKGFTAGTPFNPRHRQQQQKHQQNTTTAIITATRHIFTGESADDCVTAIKGTLVARRAVDNGLTLIFT